MTPRKKAIIKLSITSLVLILICIALFIIGLLTNNNYVNIASYIATPICLILILGGISGINKQYCKKCGNVFSYKDDIEWNVLSTSVKNNEKTARVSITSYCAHCGYKKSYIKNFVIAQVKNGQIIEKNLEKQISNLYKK